MPLRQQFARCLLVVS